MVEGSGQDWHVEAALAPGVSLKVLGGQGVQDWEPSPSAYFPAGHRVHCIGGPVLLSLKDPGLHN